MTNNPCNGGAGIDISGFYGDTNIGDNGYVGGGGGGVNQAGYPTPLGGVGGGGQGTIYNQTTSLPGMSNTGGGGGGGGLLNAGGTGGSGIIIVRYAIAYS
jgi:hypothetical protein